jgi:hypothetical protein
MTVTSPPFFFLVLFSLFIRNSKPPAFFSVVVAIIIESEREREIDVKKARIREENKSMSIDFNCQKTVPSTDKYTKSSKWPHHKLLVKHSPLFAQ